MKKFAFTLEKLRNMKQMQQTELKKEMESIDKQIDELAQTLAQLEKSVAAETRKRQADFKKGVSANQLMTYELFFAGANEEKKQLCARLTTARREKEGLLERLTRLLNELKALDKAYDAQYEQYRHEVQVEENKELDGLLSFRVHAADR